MTNARQWHGVREAGKMRWHRVLAIASVAFCVASCATVDLADGQDCKPAAEDVVVRLVQTLSKQDVARVEPVSTDLSLQYRCKPQDYAACVWRVDEGEEDFRSTRLAMYHRESSTLIIAEGQDEEYVVSRIGFENDCISLPTARPLHMASKLDNVALKHIFASPDNIYSHTNLLTGDGLIASLAKDPSVYLKFARDWAASLLDDLTELIRF